MLPFPWRRRKTRHFGEQWVPFAEVHFKSTSGRWYSFSTQVDTGAAISVVPRSVADLLGIPLSEGDSIELSGVDAPPHRYTVVKLATRIGDMPEFQMRVAIAEHEDVPNLLGRLDVLDRYQIDLDASLRETRITALWLDDGLRDLWHLLMETEKTVLASWLENPLAGRTDEAAKRFVNRADQLVAAGAGLLKLHRGFELPLVIRSLWELSIQFEYLMRDPVPRSELYLEYAHVTKYKSEQAWSALPGPVGKHLRADPRRVEGVKRLRTDYDRVKPQYAKAGNPNKVRPHWYPGTLRDLAEESGRLDEYKAIYGIFSAWAHGDPEVTGRSSLPHGGLVQLFMYWARLLILVADEKKIILTGDSYRALQHLAKGMS